MSSFDEPNLEIGERGRVPGRWGIGDRALALRDGVWLYPGTVGELKDHELYIFFDDGDRAWVPTHKVQPIDIREGSRVFSRSNGMGYSPGIIKYRNGDQLLIEFENGEPIWTVLATIRLHRTYSPGEDRNEPSESITNAYQAKMAAVGDGGKTGISYEELPIFRKWRAGDRVMAPDGNWLYPGVVDEIRDEEINIVFDNGKRAWVNRARVRPLEINVGTRVYCRWMSGAVYYSGTVKQKNGEMIFIHYDDGDKEWNTIALTRIPAHGGAAFLGGVNSLFLGRFGCLIWVGLFIALGFIFGWFK